MFYINEFGNAFGLLLPYENYYCGTIHPKDIVTKNNLYRSFKEQLQSLIYSFDWAREINTRITVCISETSGFSLAF